MSIKNLAPLAIFCLVTATNNLAANADDEIVKVRQGGAPVASETTTTTTDAPVLVHDGLGGDAIVPGSTSIQTRTTDLAPGPSTVIEEKKKASHHLINLFGVKVF